MSMHDPAADRALYRQLISACADQVPETFIGRHDVEQLPALTAEEIALVCRHEDDAVEYLIDGLDLTQLGAVAADECELGRRMAALLQRACRRAIAYGVMCEVEQRQIERDRERELRRRTPESLDARHGVAHLFRETHR